MRIAVTGGSGFIGSHVIDCFAVQGHEVVNFDLAEPRWPAPCGVRNAIGDVANPDDVRRALRGCDAVVHLAAVADVNDVVADPTRAQRINALGTQTILDEARSAGIHVVYGSTVWVYGNSEAAEPLHEDGAIALPAHLYTATKLAGEMYCRSYAALYGVSQTILRFGIPYGPRSRPAAVVAAFTERARRGDALTIAGDGSQTRQFVYVEDLAEGIVTATLSPGAVGQTYNLVGDEETSVREIADAVRAAVADVPVEHGPERPVDARLGRVSSLRAARDLGWRATTPFLEGVVRYVEWLTLTSGSPVAETASRSDGRAATVLRQEPTEL